jgi:hypothetical protein
VLDFLDVNVLNLLTFAWLTAWAGLAMKRLVRGDRDTILFLLLAFWLFFGAPLGLDLAMGVPAFDTFPGATLAVADAATNSVYCAFVAFVPVCWWYTARTPAKQRGRTLGSSGLSATLAARLRPVLVVVLLTPLPVAMFAPKPEVYLVYGATAQELLTVEQDAYHSIVVLSALSAVAAALTLLLLSDRTRLAHVLAVIPPVLVANWLGGKRSIVAITIMFTAYVAWQKGHLRGSRVVVAAVVAAAAMAGFSTFYQGNVRNVMARADRSIYENVRTDYGRDAVTKLAIYAELYPARVRILEYRFESFLFNVACYCPRKWWRDKPWPYPYYATSAMLLIPPQMLTWGVTTSCLDEAIANVGWGGMLVGPLWISLFCRIGDRFKSAIVRMVTLLLTLLLLVVNFSVCAPIFLSWVFLVVWTRYNRTNDGGPDEAEEPNRLAAPPDAGSPTSLGARAP